MAEILMVGGRGHLIAGVGHVLTAAIMLPEVVPGLFFFWSLGFCGFFLAWFLISVCLGPQWMKKK